jgi:hypothetical protein
VWQEPKTPEFADLTAYDDPQTVVNRLASRAKEHWDKRDSVKEGSVLLRACVFFFEEGNC